MKKILKPSMKILFGFFMLIMSIVYINNAIIARDNVFAQEPNTIINLAYNQLDEKPKKLYEYLKQKIESVVSGDVTQTSFIINSATLSDWEVKTKWTNTELGKEEITFDDVHDLFLNQLDPDKVMNALVHDMPYELFWFDKTIGMSRSIGASVSVNYERVTITSVEVVFCVCKDYALDPSIDEPSSVDQSKILAASSALDKAKNIVSNYNALNDYQKILAYKNIICEMVSYNDAAASESYSGGYGDPWQAIYVFDDDATTNVVCEGYSKAFQLLCNLSTFKNNVVCYTVSGVLGDGSGEGAHMWNIVVMDDELSYLVDVTNSDLGSIGQSGGLFLEGNNLGSVTSGYSFNLGSVLTYSYSEETKSLWGIDSESVLTLASSNYHVNHPEIDISQDSNLTYDGSAITIGQVGALADISYGFVGDEDETLYDFNYEYHTDNDGAIGTLMSEAPKNAGNYWVKIVATNKIDNTYKIAHSEMITIKAKELSILSVVAEGKEYDATLRVNVTQVSILGLINGDEAYVNLSLINASVSDEGIGTYNYVNLTNLSLLGEDSKNYFVSSQAQNIDSNSIQIVKAEPYCVAMCTKVNEEGKSLKDISLDITAKGANNITLTGTFAWVDEDGNEIDENTEIIKLQKYWFKFTPNDPNYTSTLGYVTPWGEESSAETKELSPTDYAKFIEYSLYALAGVILISCLVITIKKKKRG